VKSLKLGIDFYTISLNMNKLTFNKFVKCVTTFETNIFTASVAAMDAQPSNSSVTCCVKG